MKSNYTECTIQSLSDHFYEAVSTTRKLPAVKVQGYFCTWPGIIHTPQELMLMEARATKVPATPDAISRLEHALEWMQWLSIKERKLIWHRAARVPWKQISQEFRFSQSTGRRIRLGALAKIRDRLNKKSAGKL